MGRGWSGQEVNWIDVQRIKRRIREHCATVKLPLICRKKKKKKRKNRNNDFRNKNFLKQRLFRTIKKGDPPVEAACLSLWQAAEAVHNRNSNLRIDNSHRNRDHCIHLDNPHNRNSRNHNL